jgi:predicted acylesterase/phospholipase RssA
MPQSMPMFHGPKVEMKSSAKPAVTVSAADRDRNGDSVSGTGQIVLVFQGGGALGAYQAGVYQALHEASIEPDWIISVRRSAPSMPA